MTFTVVGTSTHTDTNTTAHTFAVPLPAGTGTGDLIAVGTFGGGADITDGRLTTYRWVGGPSDYSCGGWGIATDLSDVTLATKSLSAGIAIVITLTDVTGAPTLADAGLRSDYPDQVYPGMTGYGAGVAFVCHTQPTGAGVGTSATWTDQGEVNTTALPAPPSLGYLSLRCFTFDSGTVVPSLTVTDTVGGGGRSDFRILWPGSSRGLRQRQGPRGGSPRDSWSDLSLRQRQTP